jgi:hypothetical protein
MSCIEQVYCRSDPKRHLFVELLASGGRGHDPDDTLEMLQRLDSHAGDKDIADREKSTGT